MKVLAIILGALLLIISGVAIYIVLKLDKDNKLLQNLDNVNTKIIADYRIGVDSLTRELNDSQQEVESLKEDQKDNTSHEVYTKKNETLTLQEAVQYSQYKSATIDRKIEQHKQLLSDTTSSDNYESGVYGTSTIKIPR